MHLINLLCTCVCARDRDFFWFHGATTRHDNMFTMTTIRTIMLVFFNVSRIQQTNTDALTDAHTRTHTPTHAKPMRALHH